MGGPPGRCPRRGGSKFGCGAALAVLVMSAGGGWGLGGCGPAGRSADGRGFAASRFDEAMAVSTLDAGVIAGLAEHDWAILRRRMGEDGWRVYEILSVADEPGWVRVRPREGGPQEGDASRAWWRIDAERIEIEASVGLFPHTPRERERAGAIVESVRARLDVLAEHGHAAMPE